jgi:hypothetical protein
MLDPSFRQLEQSRVHAIRDRVNPARGTMRFDAMANASMAKSVAAAMALAALLHLLASAIAIFAIRRRG